MDIILNLVAKKNSTKVPVQRMWEDGICAVWDFTQRRTVGSCRRFETILGPIFKVLTVQKLSDH